MIDFKTLKRKIVEALEPPIARSIRLALEKAEQQERDRVLRSYHQPTQRGAYVQLTPEMMGLTNGTYVDSSGRIITRGTGRANTTVRHQGRAGYFIPDGINIVNDSTVAIQNNTLPPPLLQEGLEEAISSNNELLFLSKTYVPEVTTLYPGYICYMKGGEEASWELTTLNFVDILSLNEDETFKVRTEFLSETVLQKNGWTHSSILRLYTKGGVFLNIDFFTRKARITTSINDQSCSLNLYSINDLNQALRLMGVKQK